MGIVYLVLSKISAILKMITMKGCGQLASGALGSTVINLIRTLGCLLISVGVCAFSGFSDIGDMGMLLAIISGIANAILLFSWVLAARNASLCTVEIFCMIGGIALPLILTPIFIPEDTVSVTEWVAALLLFPAAYLYSGKRTNESSPVKALPFLILSMIGNAGCVITQKLFTVYSAGAAQDFNLYGYFFSALTLGVILLITVLFGHVSSSGKENNPVAAKADAELGVLTDRRKLVRVGILITVAVVMLYLSSLLSTLAAAKLDSAFFFAMSYAIGMPLTVLADIVVFKEKLTVRAILATVIVLASVILFSL